MNDKHASTRFPVFGTEVEKLFNSRYRITVRCDVANRDEDWYYANRSSFWKDFGDLYTASLDVDGVDDGWNVRDGEAYPNMRLVRTAFNYLPNRSAPVLTFIYETLPDTFTQEAADKVDYELNGLRRVTRPVIAKDGANYTKTVGTTTISHNEHGQGALTLTLGSAVESDKGENEGGFVRYIETWYEPGILQVKPVEDGGFNLAASYIFLSIGKSPGTLHAGSPLPLPSGGTLSENATFFEPAVTNVEGFPSYTQFVINAGLTGGEVKVDSREGFFQVTEPGVMNLGFTFSYAENSGAAVNFPEAESLPKTYRKKATVDVFLTTSATISETEVAFTEENTDWCSAAFINYYFNDANGTSTTSGTWRPFNQFLKSSDVTSPFITTSVGSPTAGEDFEAVSETYIRGDETYVTTGVYRVELSDYLKSPDGTQYYLRTVVSFA